MSTPVAARRHLDRDLGLGSVVAICMSAMIGGGLFVLPGPAAGMTGASLWAAYVISCLLVLPAAFAKSELGTAMPAAGGSYLYVERAIGPWAGTVVGLGLWISLLFKSSFALVGISAYLELVTPVHGPSLALALLALITIINILGVGLIGRFQGVIIVIAFGSLAVVSVGSVIEYTPSHFEPQLINGWKGLAAATGFVFVSYAGVTKIAAVAEEVENPKRNLPLGILLSLVTIGCLYALVSIALVNKIPLEQLSADIHPIDTLFRKFIGDGGRYVAIIVAAITLTGMANTGLLSASRFPFAMARDRMLPSFLAHISPHSSIPQKAVLTSSFLCALTIVFLDIVAIAKLASAFVITIFILVEVCVIIFRESGTGWYKPGFKVPLYPTSLIIGIAGQLLVLVFIGGKALAGISLSIVIGTAWYYFYVEKRVNRKGILEKAGPRNDFKTGIMHWNHGLPEEERSTVVALFGHERSPEQLAVVGHSLSEDQTLEILLLRDLPDFTEDHNILLDEDHDSSVALQRRLLNASRWMAKSHQFDIVISRDVRKSLYDYVSRSGSRWLVLEWHSRLPGSALLGSPYQWLFSHIPCNLALYRDAGFRITRRILAWPSPGPHDALVIRTADNLADHYGAELTFAITVDPRGILRTRQAAVDYADQVRQLVSRVPEIKIIDDEKLLGALVHHTADHDLLVIGAAPESPFLHSFRFVKPFEERLTELSFCPVLWLKTPKSIRKDNLSGSQKDTESPVKEIFRNATCRPQVKARSKDDLMLQITRELTRRLPDLSEELVLSGFKDREKMQNTGVGEGIAMPHGTLMDIDRIHLVILTLAEPVDYGSPDGRPVDICFATVGPPSCREQHLLLLAELAKIGLDPDCRRQIREAKNESEIKRIILPDLTHLDKKTS